MKNKKWIRYLKVGDTICDCRGKHLRISKIEEIFYAKNLPVISWLFKFFGKYEWYESVCFKLGLSSWEDKDLTLEDGATCSAYYCCSVPNHKEEYVTQKLE